jgi:hypothetical protein
MTTTDDGFKDMFAIYCGRITTVDKKSAALWLPVDLMEQVKTSDDALSLASAFVTKSRDLPRIIGITYAITGKCDEAGGLTNMRGSYKYRSDAPSGLPDTIKASLQARDEALKVADRVQKNYAELRNDAAIRTAIGALRQSYLSTDRIGRLALEVVVLDILRNG